MMFAAFEAINAAATLVSMARLGCELCEIAKKTLPEEVKRIQGQLEILLLTIQDWQNLKSNGSLSVHCSDRSLMKLNEAVEDVNLALQSVTANPKKWPKKVQAFMHGRGKLESLLAAESKLQGAMQLLQVQGNNHILDKQAQLEKKIHQHMLQDNKLVKQQIQSLLAKVSLLVPNEPKDYDQTSSLGLPASLQIDRSALECTFNRKVDLIGEGGFSDVFRAKQDGVEVAVKQLRTRALSLGNMTNKQRDKDRRRLEDEAKLLQACSVHPNILQIYGCSSDFSEEGKAFLVLELMDTNLFYLLHNSQATGEKNLSFIESMGIMKGIASAIEFLHLKGIIHMDIKSQNILLNQDFSVAKLSDFGEAKTKGLFESTRVDQTQTLTSMSVAAGRGHLAGTIAYQAPEIVQRKTMQSSRAGDIHAFGVTLWECLTGAIPHLEKGMADQYQVFICIWERAKDLSKETMLDFPSEPPALVGVDHTDLPVWKRMRDLSKRCLSRNPKLRPSAALIVEAWEDPTAFLASVGTSENEGGSIRRSAFENTAVFQKTQEDVPTTLSTQATSGSLSKQTDCIDSSHAQPTKEIFDEEACLSDKQAELQEKRRVKKWKWVVIIGIGLISMALVTALVLMRKANDDSSQLLEPTSSPMTISPIPPPTQSPTFQLSEALPDIIPLSPTPVNQPTLAPQSPADPLQSRSYTGIEFKFDCSVAMSWDGNRLVAGSRSLNGSNRGEVKVFEWNGTAWTQVGRTISAEGGGDHFGYSVTISAGGNRVASSAPGNDGDIGANSGHVRVYDWDGNGWVQIGQDIDGEAPSDRSGDDIAMSANGNRIVISSSKNDAIGSNSGHIRIYEWNGDRWAQVGTDIDGEGTDHRFGKSVAISSDGTRVVASGDGIQAGRVRVFDWNGMEWIQAGSNINGEGAGDVFGVDIAMSWDGNRIVVGAHRNDGNGMNAGLIRVLDWDGNEWIQVGSVIDGEAAGDGFGEGVAISADGNRIVAGASSNDGNGGDAGHVRVFDWNGINWVKVLDIDGELSGDGLGERIAMSSDGSRVVAAAYRDDGNGSGTGHVGVFDVPS